MNYAARLLRLQEKLRRKKLDALIVSQPENRRYLSGYQAVDHGIGESAGVLLVPARGQATLLTDFRFQQQAEQETGFDVKLYQKGLAALLDNLLADSGVRRLAFESHYTLHSFSLRLTALAEKRKITLIPTRDLVESLRLVKDEQELDCIRRSVALNELVFGEIRPSITPEMSEVELAVLLESAMRRAGAERPSFDTIVASGPNGALPHAVPGTRRLAPDQSLTIDMGLVLSGYCSDMTRTFVIGNPDQRYLSIHRIVRKAQKVGIAAVRAGASMQSVDRAARRIIADAGYGKYFGHSLGHGVGLAIHEAPRVSGRSRQKLSAGMVITIEPGIYLPGWGGVRLENMVVVREDGCENLNNDETWLDI